MSNQPLNAASLRGAVDLSSLKKPQGGAPAGRPASAAGAPTGSAGAAAPANAPSAANPGQPPMPQGADDAVIAETFRHDGLVVDVTAENFQGLVQQSVQHPVIIAIWAGSQPASLAPVASLARAVRAQEGRVLMGVADLDTAPEIGQVFAQLSQQAAQQGQPGQILAAAFVQGQPIPIPPVVEDAQTRELVDQIVQIAVQNGLAGRVANYDPNATGQAGAEGGEHAEPELPPLHQLAYESIDKGDYDGAIAAFEQALTENPKDEEARLALGQVKLMQRTQGVDLQAARDAAAKNPADVTAQTQVADLDVLGGHVEDAFARLVDVVKATSGDERNAAREHLIGLFDVVGATDPRVKKARTALMSALY